MIYKRQLDLASLLKNKSYFLFGPRSTGKTTLIEKSLPDAIIYDLLDNDVFNRLSLNPKLITEEVSDLKKIIVIDEIQKLPKLLDEVHRIIKKENRIFLLTGSSARKLRRGGANLLGGRAREAHLMPLSYHEIPHFNLLHYLNFGGLPHIYPSDEPNEELKSYVNLYLKEEIIAEGLTRNYENFLRFFEAIALTNGQELNYEGIASDSGVPARTVQNYVQILIDTLMGYELRPFLKTKSRKAITRSKFFLFDLGVTGKLSHRGLVEAKSPLFGQLFEHFIINEIRTYISYSRKDEDLYYWRSTSGFEVDCIIGMQMAVEIKSTKMVGNTHLKGLRALKEENLIKSYAMVSMDAKRRHLEDGITVYPWEDFLKQLWAGNLC